ncbi:MAG: TatD family hydrolase [Candidatus Acetothermia bacterium]|nr:TatD family hydrolase [Candidatus Acetothermia bacterium]
MMMIDTHLHLEMREFDPDREAVVQRAREAGIGLITVGIDLESSARAVELAHEHKIYAAVGVHPHEARRYAADLERALARLEELARAERVVALGEIGLDYYRNYSPREAQLELFRAQLKLAAKLNKPVIVHDRQADDDILAALEGAGVRGVVHSFSSGLEEAEALLGLGFYLGFSGPVTFPKARQRYVIKRVPLARLLLETDAPFLTPLPHRGRRNEPAYLRYIAREVAKLTGLPREKVAEQTTRNAAALFALPPG